MGKTHIIVASHGQFGEALIKSASMIMGKLENTTSLSLFDGEALEDFLHKSEQQLREYENEEIVVLVDIYGGTPCNVLTALTQKFNHKVFTGVSLPMLIDLYLYVTSNEIPQLDDWFENYKASFEINTVYTNKKLGKEN